MAAPTIPATVIEPIERAVASDRATSLAGVLARLGTGAFADDRFFAPPHPARYTRFPLWRDPQGRFAIVCMTWLPGQGTPIHDHRGRWGAELVVRGAMHETSYGAVERRSDGATRLAPGLETTVRAGEIGIVVPTVDVHALRNTGPEVARTVHVYSTLRDACTTFVPGGDGWWVGAAVELQYDD